MNAREEVEAIAAMSDEIARKYKRKRRDGLNGLVNRKIEDGARDAARKLRALKDDPMKAEHYVRTLRESEACADCVAASSSACLVHLKALVAALDGQSQTT